MTARQSAAMDRAVALVLAGSRPKEAATQAGVSQGALRRALRRAGVPAQPVGQPPKPRVPRYPLSPMSIGEDTHIIISRGHHDVHELMAAVRREGWDWPLGMPRHLWFKTMPARRDGYLNWLQPVTEGTRGAWPCTYVSEAYGEDSYEELTKDRENQS